MSFEILEDVTLADVAFRAHGESLEALFKSASDAMLSIMLKKPESLKPRQVHKVLLKNDSLDYLLYDFLQEMIFLKDAKGVLSRADELHIGQMEDFWVLEGSLKSERIDPETMETMTDIKAVTMHQLSVRQGENGWTATVVVDV